MHIPYMYIEAGWKPDARYAIIPCITPGRGRFKISLSLEIAWSGFRPRECGQWENGGTGTLISSRRGLAAESLTLAFYSLFCPSSFIDSRLISVPLIERQLRKPLGAITRPDPDFRASSGCLSSSPLHANILPIPNARSLCRVSPRATLLVRIAPARDLCPSDHLRGLRPGCWICHVLFHRL